MMTCSMIFDTFYDIYADICRHIYVIHPTASSDGKKRTVLENVTDRATAAWEGGEGGDRQSWGERASARIGRSQWKLHRTCKFVFAGKAGFANLR